MDPLEVCESVQLALLRCVKEIREIVAAHQDDATMMSISQAADHLKVTAQTLRRYEREGKLVPQRRPGSKYRYYTRSQLNEYKQQTDKTPAAETPAQCTPGDEPHHDDEEPF